MPELPSDPCAALRAEAERLRESLANSQQRLAELEDALRGSQEKYAKAFRLSPDAININRLADGVYLDINQGFTAITGYTAEDVIGHSSLPGDLGLWVEAADRERMVAQLKECGEVVGFEARFRRKDGTLLTGLFSARVLELDGVPCILSISRDISDRKRAETALMRSEERFRSLVEMAVDAILLGDQQGNIIGANRRAEELTGYPVDELRCLNIAQLFSDDERRRKPLRYDLLRDHKVITTERQLACKDGRSVPIEMTSRMMPDGTYQAFIRDISLRRQHEADRAQAKQRLGESQKLEALGQLAGGIAHDFNNQLAGILGNAELLAQRLEDPRLRPFAERIITAAERSAALTRQLLSFARKGRNLTVGVDIHRLIGEVVELLSHSIDKRITIHQRLAASCGTSLGDPDQLQNALLNLGINARDAMPDGGELTFATDLSTAGPGAPELELPAGAYLRISVIDTGAGMDEETRRHLFEPFFTTKQQGKGTGLGLASVYGTVKEHRGAIRISSQPGCGTSVVIHLPLHRMAEVASPAGAPPAEARETGIGRILLVDDEDGIREITAEMLRSLGYQVAISPDGAAAVETYRRTWREIDLVILDLVMPAMGGREAFLAMQAVNPDLRALISSGYSMDGEVQALISLGAADFVHKPYRIADLHRRIRSALGRQPAS